MNRKNLGRYSPLFGPLVPFRRFAGFRPCGLRVYSACHVPAPCGVFLASPLRAGFPCGSGAGVGWLEWSRGSLPPGRPVHGCGCFPLGLSWASVVGSPFCALVCERFCVFWYGPLETGLSCAWSGKNTLLRLFNLVLSSPDA